MGILTSEVGYTSAMPRREDHEVHKEMWGHWTKKKKPLYGELQIMSADGRWDLTLILLKWRIR